MFKENLPKKGRLFREFWTLKPTHIGGTYPYPQHVMLPPPWDNTRLVDRCLTINYYKELRYEYILIVPPSIWVELFQLCNLSNVSRERERERERERDERVRE